VGVSVVNIRKVRVRVNQPLMTVSVVMRFPGGVDPPVDVVMVFVMDMLVLHGLVDVLVLVMLRKMQPNAKSHEQARACQLPAQRWYSLAVIVSAIVTITI
jgi:hypothetical protein